MVRGLGMVLVALALTGCGSSTTPPPTPTTTTVSGTVVVGSTATSGNVAVYDFSSGSKGALLASGSIAADGSGHFSLNYTTSNAPAAILVETTDECYDENAYFWAGGGMPGGMAVASVCGFAPLPALDAVAIGGISTVAVTPYTHAELGLVQYEIRHGVAVSTALADAETAFNQLLGFDPVTTLPAMPQPVETESAAAIYGGLIAAIPSWLYNVAYDASGARSATPFGSAPMTTLNFADDMRSDLAEDGVLNGMGRDSSGASTSLSIAGVPLTTAVYRHGLAKYAVTQLRGYFESGAGDTVSGTHLIVPFLTPLVAYNGSSVLFDSSPITPLDENDPVVILRAPLAGATLSGSAGVTGIVQDIVGVPADATLPGETVLLVDGVVYEGFSDRYNPNWFVNTTIFPNGAHTLTLQTTDNLGNTASSSVSVTFSN